MMARARGSGSVYQQKTSAFWWIKYHRNGKTYRESSHSKERRDAVDLLKRRLAEITTGAFLGPVAERIRVDELADEFLRDYRINDRRSIDDVAARWNLHLKPFFGGRRAVEVTSDLLARYVDGRQQEQAANATMNRELAALKRMFYLGYRSTPPKVQRVPAFPRLTENNARKGFLEDSQYANLVQVSSAIWFRALLELGRTYGWRIGELLSLRVKQVDLLARTIRLEPGTTKNRDGREVSMTESVYRLLAECVNGKDCEDFVITWPNGRPVRDFRETWWKACTKAGLGRMVCGICGSTVKGHECHPCKSGGQRSDRLKYVGLIFHDLRRTAARNLRRAGVAEGVIMKIGGWRTRSLFERYAIVSQSDVKDALQKLETHQNGHTLGHTDGEARPTVHHSNVQ